jgi:hypothetical protein
MMIKRYSELKRYETFDERLEYLKLHGGVGRSTFGYDRYLNQRFYTSYEWKRTRQEVIVRDHGCDLGVRGYEIHADLYVHHINPMTAGDIIHGNDWILNPEFLITTTIFTHNSIHFGDDNSFPKVVVARSRDDTKLW